MPVELREENAGRLLVARVTGTLSRHDYHRLVPQVDRLIGQHGHLSILFQMADFHGWDAGAMWEDLKFALGRFFRFDRIALVGHRDQPWQRCMPLACRLFTTARLRFFDLGEMDQARQWVAGERPVIA